MTRYVVAAVCALAATAADAQVRRPACAATVHVQPYVAPQVVQPYAAPAPYAPAYAAPVVKYENVIVVPAAVYTLPGPPTVQLNIYPASQTFVQPVAAPAAVLTPDQAARAQVIPLQVPPGADVRVIQVPVPVTPSK